MRDTQTVADDERSREYMTGRWVAWVLVSLSAIPIFAFLVWLGTTRYWPAVWIAALPAIYLAASLLYRYEDYLPGWLSRILDIAAEYVPTIAWLKRRKDVVRTNTLLIEDLGGTLHEYGLGGIPADISAQAAGWGRQLTIHAAVNKVAPRLSPRFDHTVLELLHRERFGLPTLTLWQGLKRKQLSPLSTIVPQSDRLPRPSIHYPYTDLGEVKLLLAALRDFDVGLLAREIRTLDTLAGRRSRAETFFEHHGLSPGGSGPVQLAARIEAVNGLPTDDATMFRVEDLDFALDVLGEADGSEPSAAVRMVRLGAFLADRERDTSDLLTRLCHRATVTPWLTEWGPDPVDVLHGYLWERHRLAMHGRSVLLSDVASSWHEWERAAAAVLGPAHSGELADLRAQLATGTWPMVRDSSGTFHAEPAPEHDEVKVGDAYLITFAERAGPVADLIDCLTDDDYASQLTSIGVTLTRQGRRLYRFAGFTKNTRLGVLPKGMPFHEFHEMFAKDMELVLRNRTSLFPGVWLPTFRRGTRTVEYDDHRQVILTAPGRSTVDFLVLPTVDQGDPLRTKHGRLAGEPQKVTRNRAVVEYVAGPAPSAGEVDGEEVPYAYDEVHYAYRLPRAGWRPGVRHLLLHPEGYKELKQFEITLDRIDLRHCRELWFGGPLLGPLTKSPSICKVWAKIKDWLDLEEQLTLKPLFDMAAGGPGCPEMKAAAGPAQAPTGA